jgi:hypothetical protein
LGWAKAPRPGVRALNQLLGGGCCGAGSGVVFTASCRESAATADKAMHKAKQRVIQRELAVRLMPSRLIVSPCRLELPAPSTPKIRQSASSGASEIGELGENALDRLAYQGEFAQTLFSKNPSEPRTQRSGVSGCTYASAYSAALRARLRRTC